MVASTFQELSLEATKSFLQTVVVVDDEANLDGMKSTTPTQVTTPGRRVARTSDSSDGPGRVNNTLDAKELIDKFAIDGLVCAVLKPASKREGIITKVDKATQRADIVILDWRINDTYGDRTLEIIEKILSTDSQEKDRLRLIAIYTGEQDLLEISTKIEAKISDIYNGSVSVSDDHYSIEAGPTRIVIFSKSDRGLPEEHMSRVVEVGDLPTKIISEFSSLYSGLLNNTTLAAIGEIRAITHRILGKFSKNLDSAYLNHRALNTPPEEAETHVVPIISSEIQDALEGRDVHRFLSKKAIELWLSSKSLQAPDLSSRMGDDVVEGTAIERLQFVLQQGVKASTEAEEELQNDKWKLNIKKLSKGNAPNLRSYITSCFFENHEDALRADQSFSLLTSVRTRYETPPPQMRLGTVVSEGEGDSKNFFLCVQPLCDSVRLPSDGRDFVFLQVNKTDSPDVVVKDKNGDIIELKIDYSPYQSVHFRFKPKRTTGVVVAKENNGLWVFKSGSRKKLRWVADLKMAHAQRIANQYATQISRVGLTESEWLRRGAKG